MHTVMGSGSTYKPRTFRISHGKETKEVTVANVNELAGGVSPFCPNHTTAITIAQAAWTFGSVSRDGLTVEEIHDTQAGGER